VPATPAKAGLQRGRHFRRPRHAGPARSGYRVNFEIQIFDPATKIYSDGQAAAVYGQTSPLVNASLPLALGAHHNPVRFRNIWIRSL